MSLDPRHPLPGTRALVAGAARSGVAAARLLRGLGPEGLPFEAAVEAARIARRNKPGINKPLPATVARARWRLSARLTDPRVAPAAATAAAAAMSWELGGYTFRFEKADEIKGPNYRALRATIRVDQDGRELTVMHPEKRLYASSGMPMTEAAIRATLTGDLYVALGDAASPTASCSTTSPASAQPSLPPLLTVDSVNVAPPSCE